MRLLELPTLRQLTAAAALAALLTGCPSKEEEAPFRAGDATEAAAETTAASAALSLAGDDIEIATDFTIGEGVQKAAESLRDFYESQIPCAAVSLADRVVTVDFGATGDCVWRGRVYRGQHKVGIDRAESGEIEVGHEWIDFTDGRVTVTGDATVTWSLADKTRRVEHDLTWTLGDKTGRGTGDRTQTALGDGGLRIDGQHTWTGPAGTWIMEIDQVVAYAADPVPESGVYRLVTPKDHEVTLAFERLDEARIEVTLSAAGKSFRVIVRKAGQVEAAS